VPWIVLEPVVCGPAHDSRMRSRPDPSQAGTDVAYTVLWTPVADPLGSQQPGRRTCA